MDRSRFLPARRIDRDTHLLPACLPLPGFGVMPVHAFLIRARDPVLVDTGIGSHEREFMDALGSLIDPADLRWIWVTHAHSDHAGNLRAVMAAAPRARVVTNYIGLGKLGLRRLPPERTWLLNPGQSLDVGDRRLLALRPPLYDAPETMAAFDAKAGNLFSSDCFGAVIDAPTPSATDIPPADLAEGMALWARIDAPWLSHLDAEQLRAACLPIRELAPRRILGGHLPPADAFGEAFADALEQARQAAPFVGPDQAAMEALAGLVPA